MPKKINYTLEDAPEFTPNDVVGIVNYTKNGKNEQYTLPTYDEYVETVGNGTEEHPFKLREITAYPNTIELRTYNPFHSMYFPGHSSIRFTSIDPDLPSGMVNTHTSDPYYDFVTNNCADDTRKVLEYTFGRPVNCDYFTTPGDVRDHFTKLGAITKHKRGSLKSTPTTTQIMNVSKSQYLDGINKIKQINAPRVKQRSKKK